MGKQQQEQQQIMLQLNETNRVTTVGTTMKTGATKASSSSSSLEDRIIANFAGCGLNRSCPQSVTELPSRAVRLNHYQVGSIREQQHRKSLRRRIITRPTKVVRTSSVETQPDSDGPDSTIRDHEFEWYDLDEIHGANSVSNKNSIRKRNRAKNIGHDFRAGLVFTTERQVLSRGAQVNRVVDPLVASKICDNTQHDLPVFEFDSLIFWISSISNNSNSSYHNNQTGDREFLQNIEALEQEMTYNNSNNDDDLSSMFSSSSTLPRFSSHSYEKQPSA